MNFFNYCLERITQRIGFGYTLLLSMMVTMVLSVSCTIAFMPTDAALLSRVAELEKLTTLQQTKLEQYEADRKEMQATLKGAQELILELRDRDKHNQKRISEMNAQINALTNDNFYKNELNQFYKEQLDKQSILFN